jgi:hypothetical protein
MENSTDNYILVIWDFGYTRGTWKAEEGNITLCVQPGGLHGNMGFIAYLVDENNKPKYLHSDFSFMEYYTATTDAQKAAETWINEYVNR